LVCCYLLERRLVILPFMWKLILILPLLFNFVMLSLWFGKTFAYGVAVCPCFGWLLDGDLKRIRWHVRNQAKLSRKSCRHTSLTIAINAEFLCQLSSYTIIIDLIFSPWESSLCEPTHVALLVHVDTKFCWAGANLFSWPGLA
jgi:hypothetical protein